MSATKKGAVPPTVTSNTSDFLRCDAVWATPLGSGSADFNVDGGTPDEVYGPILAIDGGTPSMANQIQLRRGTAAEWTSANPVLADGEMGYETDSGFIKIGDGTTAWNSLRYVCTPIRTANGPVVMLPGIIADGQYNQAVWFYLCW